jgi:hypothetical protein
MFASIANRAKQFLSLKLVTLAIITLAIANRIIQLIFLFNIRADRVQQMLATQNFVSGRGISIAEVFPDNLSEIIYEPLIKWPPGYSLLLAPFYALFNHNYIAAGLALDILAAIILIFVSRGILRVLNTPIHLVNIYTLLTSFFVYSFYVKTSSDAIAITAFIIAFYFTLMLLKSNQHWAKQTVGITISLLICASIKYLFLPVVFVIPLFLVTKGLADKNVFIKKAGIFSFLVLAIILAGLLAYQKFISGSATYITSQGRGLFINHILAAFPFIPASFIKLDTLGLMFSRQPWVEVVAFRIYQGIQLLFIVFVLIWILLTITRNRFKDLSLTDSFFYLAFFVSLAITLVLLILSITVAKEETEQGGFWTYLEEPRYYGLPNVLAQLGVFVFYQYSRNRSPRFFKYVFYFMILLLLPEFFRGALFELRRLIYFGKEQYSWQVELQIQKYASEVIRKELQKRPDELVVVTGSSDYMNNRISLYSHIPILIDVGKINDLATVNTKKSILLLIALRDDALPVFQQFLSMKERDFAGHFNIYSFYTVHVSPH